jgi:CRISPR system Cascade subunit CasD
MTTVMTGLVLRLAGPLQSWGEHSTFADRDTVSYPTRSGLVGMFAGAMGLRRGEPLSRFDGLGLTVRVDWPGVPLTDFHTVGGGLPPARTVPTADGKHRSGDTGTLVSRRRYLSDAVFTVAVTGPDGLVTDIGNSLKSPFWQTYLGRRSCPPDQPLLLRTGVTDPEAHLRGRVPLPRRGRRPGSGQHTKADFFDVEFLTETHATDTEAVATLHDVPLNFGKLDRRYQRRTVRRDVVRFEPGLVYSDGQSYQKALWEYMKGDR